MSNSTEIVCILFTYLYYVLIILQQTPETLFKLSAFIFTNPINHQRPQCSLIRRYRQLLNQKKFVQEMSAVYLLIFNINTFIINRVTLRAETLTSTNVNEMKMLK